jgi:hypothetical protein
MSYQPRGLTFEQFNVGDTHICQGRTITEADVVHFAGISGDYNPLHTNEEYGKTTPFGGRIAHGVLVLAIATGQINQTGLFEGQHLLYCNKRSSMWERLNLATLSILSSKLPRKKKHRSQIAGSSQWRTKL